MTTDQSPSQSRWSTDLEMLRACVEGKSLSLAELKQALLRKVLGDKPVRFTEWGNITIKIARRPVTP
jgi:hypothetical protein